jgi:hypothetical protein
VPEIKEWMRAAERDILADVRRQCASLKTPHEWRDDPNNWAQIIAKHASPSPISINEIVPSIEKQHDAAKQIARDAGFDPVEGNFARCVGAVMRAWRPGKFWEAEELVKKGGKK